ncbi:hypothetical protein [Paenibacillus sp. FJAT-27812]|uniref:hypothetical protein n=1 Tax=Paenibacillus sp. FJAT-27812 TaxID=1684143 RepID=UPI0006A79AC5|nr:hypothetical protein [Paenibacillus sp. FJAT-27812]
MAASLREAAWNELSSGEKESLINDWRQAEVKKAKWNEVPLVLGPIGIYIDSSNNQAVGYDERE